MTYEFGLIGRSLRHSFSARYFADKFRREGIDASYSNFELEHIDSLPDLIARHPNLRGLNVTIPYKEVVLPYLTSVSPLAQRIGAVNTIVITRRGGEVLLHGDNTDFTGLRRSLEPMCATRTLRALVLGSGGASRAAQAVLDSLGIPWLLVSRSEAQGRITYPDVTRQVLREHELIVNTTPVGTWPDVDACLPLPLDALTAGHIVQELIYNPPLTRLMREALARGARVRNGLQMLHLQAEAAWGLWMNRGECHSG